MTHPNRRLLAWCYSLGVRVAPIACLVLSVGCGAEVAADSDPCEIDARVLEKRWFVGELDTEADDPYFSITDTVIGIGVEGPTPSAFVDATVTHEARFLVTDDLLVARADDGSKVSVFQIVSHREDACVRQHMEELGSEPQGPPWQERPWFRVDWSRDLGEATRFDDAAAAGHLDAAIYEPIAHYPDGGVSVDLDDGHVSVIHKSWVSWRALEDGTPGCAFDLPSLPPGAQCPNLILTMRADIRRSSAQ